MDRVREAVFSSLGERVPGADVLDLFAGSGSYALEALSRGATGATIVENNRQSLASLRANVLKTRLEPAVVAEDVFSFLRQPARKRYDLVFADPPYVKSTGEADLAAKLLHLESLPLFLKEDGLLVLETRSNWKMPDCPMWKGILERRYGDACIRILARAEDAT